MVQARADVKQFCGVQTEKPLTTSVVHLASKWISSSADQGAKCTKSNEQRNQRL